MPPIQLPKAPAIGSIRDIQRPEEIAPRADYATGTRSSRVDQLDLQAIQSNVQGAGELTDFGTQLQAQATELMKPFERLRAAREVMQAHGIALEAQLTAREHVQSLLSSGTSYTDWLPVAQDTVGKLFKDAAKRAEAISPAAGIEVMQQLQQEQLSLLSGIQTQALTADKSTMLGIYHLQRSEALSSYIREKDGAKRADMEERITKTAFYLGETGVISRDAARVDVTEFRKSLAKERILEKFMATDAPTGTEYASTEKGLSLDEQRVAINAGKNALEDRVKTEHKADVLAAQTLKNEQDKKYIERIRIVTDPNLTIQQYEDIILDAELHGTTAAPGKVPTGEMRDEQVTSLITIARRQIALKKAGPATEYHDPRRESVLSGQIARDPLSISFEEIATEQQVNSDARTRLMNQRVGMLDKKNFQHQPMYKQLHGEIATTFPTDIGVLSNPTTAGPVKDKKDQAEREFLIYMEGVASKTEGVLSSEQIRQLGIPVLEQIKTRIRELKLSDLLPQFATPPVGQVVPAPTTAPAPASPAVTPATNPAAPGTPVVPHSVGGPGLVTYKFTVGGKPVSIEVLKDLKMADVVKNLRMEYPKGKIVRIE